MTGNVRPERTGWRDQKISERHRIWGYNCPAVDLDFLMVEYNVGRPVAIVEYKHQGAAMPSLVHPTYRALSVLADIAKIPFMIAFYHNEDWWFQIIPVNEDARKIYTHMQSMTETEFVRSLYDMRKRVIEEHVLKNLKDIRPPFVYIKKPS